MMITTDVPRAKIAHLPTPLEPLPQLTVHLAGPELWVKRDDQTGLATGGNKTRKLEFLVADALQQKADTLITCGAGQSNHARQTAAAAAKFGLDAVLVLRGEQPSRVQGNLLLDELLGARIVWAGDGPLGETMSEVAAELQRGDRQPYVVPYGGSNPLGVTAYAEAMSELLQQSARRDVAFDHIVLASSSGGTQAGLVLGSRAYGYHGRILGISVDLQAPPLRRILARLTTATAEYVGLELSFEPRDFAVNDDYLGGGYAVVGELERRAIRMVAQSEGLILDPVYTGRAFGGLMDLIRAGSFPDGERVLFWHTGGTGGLFAHADVL
jgi:D-cysteine desulfhydrase